MATGTGGFDAASVYDRAATDYDAALPEFWGFLTDRTHELLELRPGQHVLDVATGTGPLLPLAARSVGPAGRVLGVDLAAGMLERARARVEGLSNVELALVDARELPPAAFDAVACVLGLFFLEDMPDFVRTLRRQVAPGGRLVVSVFGEEFYEPLISVFVEAVAAEAPDITVVQPWARTADRGTFAGVFEDAGCEDVRIEEDVRTQAIDRAGWCRIVHGSGLRRTVDALGPTRAERVLQRCDEEIASRPVTEVTVRARYAIVGG